MSGEDDFFSVARTIPFVAWSEMSIMRLTEGRFIEVPLIPRDVTPWFTALRAYSKLQLVKLAAVSRYDGSVPIWTSFPLHGYQ